jgi:hypothetical protein
MRRLAGLHLCCRSHRSREPSAWETIRASPHLAQVDWIRPRWSSRRKTKPRTKGEGWRSLIAEAFVRKTLLCPAGRALWRAWRQMAYDTEHYKPVRLANIPPSDTFAASPAAFFWSRPLMDEPPLWRVVVPTAGRGFANALIAFHLRIIVLLRVSAHPCGYGLGAVPPHSWGSWRLLYPRMTLSSKQVALMLDCWRA